ncbi:hypothetical protein BZA77DRAFT_390804 [Pyronema omphalodes]|nr:hypothetical protein BZA77DRAFT_390804 [Pyronema omphalodes]
MPGRIRLSYEATVEDTPPIIPKRKPVTCDPEPAAKRTRPNSPVEEGCSPAATTTSTGSYDFTNQQQEYGVDENFTPATTPPTTQPSTPADKKKAISKPREKKFACTYEGCNKAFTRPCRLHEHVRSHTGERPFQCTEDPENCDKFFLRDSHLKAHIKAMHTKEKPYRCNFLIPPGKEDDRGEFGFKRKPSEPAEPAEDADAAGMKECGARFSTNQHLKRHVESHLKTFPYICKDYPPCAAGFRKKGPLQRHIRSDHLGQKPWACPHKDITNPQKNCEAAFDTKGKLGNHVATHHNGMARRRHFCTICATDAVLEPMAPAIGGVMAPPMPMGTSMEINSQQDPPVDPRLEQTDTPMINAPLLPPITPTLRTVDLDLPDNYAADALLCLSQADTPSFPVLTSIPVIPTAAQHQAEGMIGFLSHAELRNHMISAHPPLCSFCPFTAKRHSELIKHVRDRHETTLPERQSFVCNWANCGQGFTKKHNLKVHTNTVHQGLKPFSCSACGLRFGHRAVMLKHFSARHSGGKVKKRKKKIQQHQQQQHHQQENGTRRGLSIAEMLTGVNYEQGRAIECLVDGCPHRFAREWDLKKHLAAESAHALTEDQVEELMKAEEGDTSASESEWTEGDGEEDYEIDDEDEEF